MMKPRPVTIRTLDLGGDKGIPNIGLEDEEKHRDARSGRRVFSFINAIYSITEFMLFFKRLYADVIQAPDIHVEISLYRCKDRQLASFDGLVTLHFDYVSQEDIISIAENLSVVDLQASSQEIAAKYARYVFQIFNCEGITLETIAGWQKKLLERRF